MPLRFRCSQSFRAPTDDPDSRVPNCNSPVSPSRATAYVLALNDLLKAGSAHRRDHAGIGFIFWTKIAPDGIGTTIRS
jgi:hypothetical protein